MSEYNEDAYREARESMNPEPCAFEKALLARCVTCSRGRKVLLAEREAMACDDHAARTRCLDLKTLLHANAVFALKLDGGPIPHAKELKVQCGGLLGIAHQIQESAAVDDVAAMVADALARFGSLADLPYDRVMPDLAHFSARRRRE